MTFLRSISLLVWTLPAIHGVAGIPRIVGSSIHPGLALNRRQSSPNAPQCDSTCVPVETVIQNSCPPSECCTQIFQEEYFDCLKCEGEASNATMADWAVAQGDVDGLTIACSHEGFPLPELTLPTQNPNRTLATVSSGGQTSSGSFLSQITISTLPGSSGLAPSNTIPQQTVTALSSQPSATQPSTAPPAPTTSPSAAMPRTGGFGLMIGLLGVVVAIWTVV
ncbi:hypothetical protein B0H12DRAFT_175720 [Mycena haematopus]|nr:hypothetical protein B0H12DRAFT_175720 [Mycena haematopus]